MILEFIYESEKNIKGNRENAGYHHFPLSQTFLKNPVPSVAL